MDSKRIEDKVDQIQISINRIDITLAAQHESLKQHMKRTDLLEKFMFIIITALVGLAFWVIKGG